MILALDPSRVLGWCRGEPGGPLSFGHLRLGPEVCTPGEVGEALDAFVSDTIEAVKPSLIVYEQPFQSPNFQTTFVLLGMGFYIDTMARLHGKIECKSIIATEATNGLVGRAKFPGKDYKARREAKKAATIAACHARGWAVTNDHEADAIAVFLLAEAKRFPEAALSRPRVLKRPTGPLFTGVVP